MKLTAEKTGYPAGVTPRYATHANDTTQAPNPGTVYVTLDERSYIHNSIAMLSCFLLASHWLHPHEYTC